MTFEDSIGVNQGDPNFCGSRTYTLSPAHLFLTKSGDTLTLTSVDPAQAGIYQVTLTIELVDYPTVPALTKTFEAAVYCQILTLTFDLGLTIAELFQVGIDVDPFVIPPFSVTRAPACSRPPSFTLAPTLGFLS